jgi:hypothetical protein
MAKSFFERYQSGEYEEVWAELTALGTAIQDDWGHWTDDKENDGSCNLPVAPDEYHKYFYSGAGPYAIPCLNPVAAAPLRYERHKTTFVNYLRICFRSGGFPGWERIEQRPEVDLAFLTADLFPI